MGGYIISNLDCYLYIGYLIQSLGARLCWKNCISMFVISLRKLVPSWFQAGYKFNETQKNNFLVLVEINNPTNKPIHAFTVIFLRTKILQNS